MLGITIMISAMLLVSVITNIIQYKKDKKKPLRKQRRGFYNGSFTFNSGTGDAKEIVAICEFVEIERTSTKTNIKVVNVTAQTLLSQAQKLNLTELISGWHNLDNEALEFIDTSREDKITSILN